MAWAGDLAIVVAAAGIVIGFLALLVTRRLAVALPTTLELFMAAGLLRLSAEATWSALSTAGGIVLLRKLIVVGVRQGAGLTPWGAGPIPRVQTLAAASHRPGPWRLRRAGRPRWRDRRRTPRPPR